MIFGIVLWTAALASTTSPQDSQETQEPQVQESRTDDRNVFRSVLDGRARMVTAQLHDELWIAYDGAHCGVHKVWRDGVSFDGAVYTTVHGPQPTSLGTPYVEGNLEEPVWWLEVDGRLEPANADYRGHRFDGDRAILRYELELPSGLPITIEETPEYVSDEDGRPGLRRIFRAFQVPRGMRVHALLRLSSMETDADLETTGLLEELDRVEVEHPFGVTRTITARLELNPNAATTLTIFFAPQVADGGADAATSEDEMAPEVGTELEAEARAGVRVEIPMTLAPPTIDGELDPQWSGAASHMVGRVVVGELEGDGDANGQFRLLYDAAYLYGLFEVQDEQAVNDSNHPFDDDAVEIYVDGGNEKTDFFEENDVQYVFGRGDELAWVGGETNHPGVEFATVDTEWGYRIELRIPWANLLVTADPGTEIGLEVHVDDDDDGEEVDAALSWFSDSDRSWGDTSRFATAVLSAEAVGTYDGESEPGLALRVYWIGRSMSRLMQLVPGQTPNVSRVIPTLDLEGPHDFGDIEDHLVAETTGFLRIPEAGRYEFRLLSDDGSRLWIDNFTVVDHDGLHGPDAKAGAIELEAGDHALRVLFFENSGGQRLSLEWRPPGAADYAIVPGDALTTRAGEVRVTSPGRKRVVEPTVTARPGDAYPLADVHPSYDLETIRPPSFEPRVGGMDFLSDGRLVICNWEPDGGVYIIDGFQGAPDEEVRVTKIASGLAEPLGLCIVDNEIFVLQKQELTHLIDRDGDEIIDIYRVVADGWGVTPNFHEFAFGLVHRDDHFYATLAIAIDPGGASTHPQDPDRGAIVKIARNGDWELVARGLRTPNGIGYGVGDAIYVTDNQGDWVPVSKLVRLQEGAFYGNRSVEFEGQDDLVDTPPIVWLPQNEIGNSPSQPVPLNDGPYAGQMLHGEVTHGGLKRVFIEEVGGAPQGCVFRFTQGLEAGINRAAWGPDGALYVGGIGSTGNWGQEGKQRFGLQRLSYNKKSTFEMLAVRAKANGIEVELTEPLLEGVGWNPADYQVSQWRYEPTDEYGGPKIDERELGVMSASVSDDRRRVFLELDGLLEGHVVYLRAVGPFATAEGEELWSTEAWYTLNRIPTEAGVVLSPPERAEPNQLTEAEAAEGFRLLFDGESLDSWTGFGREDIPGGWRVEGGEIAFHPGDGGDLATKDLFADFELRIDWKIAEGSNSGIFYRVTDEYANSWESGAEYQILDNDRHADGNKEVTSSAGNYALHPPLFDATRPPGEWNQTRIVARGDHVEHWLNGYKVVEYTLWDAYWLDKVAKSKFADMPGYGKSETGRVVLQDHGDPVWFRSVRIKTL